MSQDQRQLPEERGGGLVPADRSKVNEFEQAVRRAERAKTLLEVREALTSDKVVEAVARIPWDNEQPGAWDDDSAWEIEDGIDPRDQEKRNLKSAFKAALATLSPSEDTTEGGGSGAGLPTPPDWECCNCGMTAAAGTVFWQDFENADEGHMCPECSEWTSTQKAALWLIHGGLKADAHLFIALAAGPTVDRKSLLGAYEAVGLEPPPGDASTSPQEPSEGSGAPLPEEAEARIAELEATNSDGFEEVLELREKLEAMTNARDLCKRQTAEANKREQQALQRLEKADEIWEAESARADAAESRLESRQRGEDRGASDLGTGRPSLSVAAQPLPEGEKCETCGGAGDGRLGMFAEFIPWDAKHPKGSIQAHPCPDCGIDKKGWTPRWVYRAGKPGYPAHLVPYCTKDGGPANKVHPPAEGEILMPAPKKPLPEFLPASQVDEMEIDARRSDPEFRARLERSIEENRELLERLGVDSKPLPEAPRCGGGGEQCRCHDVAIGSRIPGDEEMERNACAFCGGLLWNPHCKPEAGSVDGEELRTIFHGKLDSCIRDRQRDILSPRHPATIHLEDVKEALDALLAVLPPDTQDSDRGQLIPIDEDDRERLREIARLVEVDSIRDDAQRDARFLHRFAERPAASRSTDAEEGKG